MFEEEALAGGGEGAADAARAPACADVPWWTDLVAEEGDGLGGPWALQAAELASMEPSGDLVLLLERGALDLSDDDALVEIVAAWRRVGAWAAAGAAMAAGVLASRDAMNPVWPATAGSVAVTDVAGDELAMALPCSRAEARTLVRHGRAFLGALAPTGQALARGQIDARRARVLVDALDDVPVPLALDVQDAVLESAPSRTAAQLAQDVARALIVADPGGAHGRHEAARRGRRVERPRCLPDGMARWWAVLPAADAVRLDTTLDVLARSARDLGDPRTLDQLRADILVGLGTGRVVADGEEVGPSVPAWTPPTPSTPSTVALGPAARPTPPGPAMAPADMLRAPVEGGPGDTGEARSADSASDVDGWRRPARRVAQRSEIRVTVPLPTLLGLQRDPGELAGYGPVTAEVARDLAADAAWRRWVTDPVSGAVLDVGRTVYRPPAALADHVRARDQRCARPGCSTAAESCELDHTTEFGRERGPTAYDNLGPLCRRDHQIKTDGGFDLRQIGPGVFEWITPTGQRYRVTPGDHGRVERLATLGRRELGPPPF